jgi:hypothetical protein
MTHLDKLLILALVLQVALTFGVLILLGRARLPLIARGEVRIDDIAVASSAWPLKSQQIANNFNNQFQLPVLFYIALVLILVVGGAGLFEVVLAFAFVATRYAHAYIHCTSNNVRQRFAAYFAGLVLLILLWGWIVVRLLVLAPPL